MYVIISTSDLDIPTVFGGSINKTMSLLYKKPLISYILNELYSYNDFIDKILIIGNNLKPVEDFFKFDYKDEFFKTKIICLKNEDSKDFITDIYSSVEYIADNLNVNNEIEILVWRGNEIIENTKIFTDYTIGSFKCKNIDVVKFTKFPHLVNNLIYLKENNELTFDNLLERYLVRDSLNELTKDYQYIPLKNDYDYYVAQAKMINKDYHENYDIHIDLTLQSINLRSKHLNEKFSRETYEKIRLNQWNLWSYYDFITLADNRQLTFLPNPIHKDIDIKGEYTNEITVKWIPDNSLRYALLYQQLPGKIWNNIFIKIMSILDEIFHKKEDSPAFRLDKSVLEDFIKNFLKNAKCSIPCVIKKHTDLIKWMELYDDFEKRFRKFVNFDTVFYNGVENRLVHGNLSLENIKCNLSNGSIHFVNPLDRGRKIVCTLEDYSEMLLDSYCLFPLFLTGKFVDYNNRGIDIPDFISESAEHITSSIACFIDDIVLVKEYALFRGLQSFFEIPCELRNAFRSFLNFRVREILNG